MPTEDDWDRAGLLTDLDGRPRTERIALLNVLDDAGFRLPQLQDAATRGLLPVLLADRVIAGEPRFTAADLAQRTGVSPELLARVRQVSGLPAVPHGEASYTQLELDAATTLRGFLDLGVPEETVLRVARVMGRTLGPLSEAMRDAVLDVIGEEQLTEVELAERLTELARVAVPLSQSILEQVGRTHFRNAIASELTGRTPHMPAGSRPVVVAFADLVGFTRLGTELPPSELVDVADRLAELGGDIAIDSVRLVKTLGDGIMLVAPEAPALVTAALALVAAADAEGAGFPQVHIGVASGEAFTRAGDWYGAPVNLAARIADAARAGSVLCTREVRDQAADAAKWSAAGARTFKGVRGSVPLFRARPRRDGQPDAP